tara:strand:- start:2223 stop:2609 length:387 start_codon:yes stop_codon:yes gene_type:complete
MSSDLSPFYWSTSFKNTTVTDLRNNKNIKIGQKEKEQDIKVDNENIFNDNFLKPVYTRSESDNYYSFNDGSYTFNRMINNLPIEQPFRDERFNIKPDNMLTTRPGFGIQQNWLEDSRSLNSRNLRHSN